MRIVAVMPIKLKNERLPGKNTMLLGDKPLLQYELLSLEETGLVDEIIVYCSDEAVVPYLPSGIRFLKRSEELDQPSSNFTQIFSEFMRDVDADIYVYAHATAPFVTVETMRECIGAVKGSEYDSAFCAANIQDFLWQDGRPLNFDAGNLPRSQDLQPIYRETSGVYVFTKRCFEKYRRRIGIKPYIKEVSYREAVDINTAEDFQLAESMLETDVRRRIRVLDVTLRDGGCVNDFNFGQSYMEKILKAQESSGVEMIELGYLDSKNGTESGRTQFKSEKSIYGSLLRSKKPGVTYVAMFDYGKYNPDALEHRCEAGIDGIRIAFHKGDRKKIPETGRKVIEKGYQLFVQPMITFRYSDAELLDLIEDVNRHLPDASGFYIVDSFGEMRPNDMRRVLNLVDHNLIPSMPLGFHSHNNLQLSYTNAMSLLQFETSRDIIVDSSIMGMGKGAGNLCTELLLGHLSAYYGKKYRLSPVMEVIDKVINQLRAENYWGYSVEYYLSSENHCSPSYAKYFYDKHMLPVNDVGKLLSLIDAEKRISFDKDYAEELYRKYNADKTVDDSDAIRELASEFEGRSVLVVGPGKSIVDARGVIDGCISDGSSVSIGLNLAIDIDVDYFLATRRDAYDAAVSRNKKVIVLSSVSKGGRENIKVLDYKNWIQVDEATHDSSLVVALNMLKACRVKEILLAGVDGFSADINENYADPDMRCPVTGEQAARRNRYYRDFIKGIRDVGIPVKFITPSLYE